MADPVERFQRSATDALRRTMATPAGKRWEPLDPELDLNGNHFLVDEAAGPGDLAHARREFMRQQWREIDRWSSGSTSSDDASGRALAPLFIGIGLVLMCGGMGSGALFGGGAWFIGGFVSIVGGVFTGIAIAMAQQQRRHVPGTLHLETVPAALGDRIRGRVTTGVSKDQLLKDGFRLELRCTRATETGHGAERAGPAGARQTLWSQEARLAGSVTDESAQWVVDFDMPVPGDQPPWTLGSGPQRIRWELHVHGDLARHAYDETFGVPVFKQEDARLLQTPS